MNFFIFTLGCKVNSCDSNEVYSRLVSRGFNFTSPEEAEVIIVNSCAVTSESVRKTRQNINKFRKINKKAFIALIGCASILEQFTKNRNLDLISNKDEIVDKIIIKFNLENKQIDNKFLIVSGEKTRAFIKIEDGCENFCSYCIIPFTRGKIKSKPIEEIKFECKKMHELGFKEIVLTGINLGKYGKDINSNLLKAIEVVRKFFKRIRLSSLEPDVIDKNFIDNISCFGEICPHFHLSLQSGSDKILRLMNRKYDSEFYLNLIDNIRNKFKDVTFATDLITGFPGENDEDFENSVDIIKKARFIKVNVFPFSPRPFTYAENLKQIDLEIKKKRTKYAIELSDCVSKKEISTFFGKEFEVLFETKKGSYYSGYSRNYIKINFESFENLCGKIKKVLFFPDLY